MLATLESLDAVLLARIQFAFTISFHFLFPAFTIGLASYLAVLEALWLWTKRDVYMDLFRFWLRIFAVSFAMGVVSGIVMSYQFGTNWSVFADKTGAVLGPLLGYEVLSAFFLEAGFLGIMLFGLQRVGKGLHFTATVLVAAGTLLSAFWILSANSWMHTPAGHTVDPETGRFLADDWWVIVFNPSFPYRFVHTVLSAYLTTAFIVGAVGAWHLLKHSGDQAARTMFSMAMWMAAIVAPLQLVAGHEHGVNTLEHQPAKIAAMEGHFKSHKGAPLILFGLPDMDAGEVRSKIEIPKLGSLVLAGDLEADIKGLDAFPRADWPNVPIVFWSFRTMAGIGMLMIAMGLLSLLFRLNGQLYEKRWFHRAAVLMGPSGLVAVLAGWITTEVGRQPYTVYGLLRTADSAAPIGAPAVAASLFAFIVVYTLVFGAGIFYLLRLMRTPPQRAGHEPVVEGPIRSAGPKGAVPVHPAE
ncbi:MAG: cytochrome ubiquinol oxidase subunit I [Hyphomicrobiaceae bacterium]